MEAAMEVGPGSGVYIPTLTGLFKSVTVTDIDEEFVANLATFKERYPNLTIIRDDITRTSLPDESFNLILCSEVIEHIHDSEAALRSMRRLLKPGGVLVLSTPQKWSTMESVCKIAFLSGIISLVRLVYREPILKANHINLLTRKGLDRQLSSAGFKTVERFCSGLYLPLLAELTGRVGLAIEKWLESKLRGGPIEGLLWTQYRVATAVLPPPAGGCAEERQYGARRLERARGV
jgi:SAM-dependent methyltransferase